MGKLDGKVAVITGAGRGIGRADALLLSGEGAAVVVADIDEAPLKEVCGEIERRGGRAAGCVCDVRKPEDCQRLMDTAVQQFGHLDILVNNAGVTSDNLLARMTDEQWSRVISITLTGTFNCIRASARYMMKRGHNGCIINISSVVGVMGNPGQANYAAAKAGIIGLTKTVAREWERYGIRCNAVAYGFVDTRLTRPVESGEVAFGQTLGIPGRVRDEMLQKMKPLSAEEAARPVLFLASAEGASLNGQVLSGRGEVYKPMMLESGEELI